MELVYRYNTTTVTVFDVAKKTGFSVEGIMAVLDWPDNALENNWGYLTHDELRFIAKQYVYAVKQLQKSTRAKRDRLTIQKLTNIRRFLENFIPGEFFFPSFGDALDMALDEERIETYFYRLLYADDIVDRRSHPKVELQLIHDIECGCSLSIYFPGLVFRSNHFYTYPDEEEGSFHFDRWKCPLAA